MRNTEKQTKVESGIKWSKYWQTTMNYRIAAFPPNSRGNNGQVESSSIFGGEFREPHCQCLYQIENKIRPTKRCFGPCMAQREIIERRKTQTKDSPPYHIRGEI
jgi:hypothetical protein